MTSVRMASVLMATWAHSSGQGEEMEHQHWTFYRTASASSAVEEVGAREQLASFHERKEHSFRHCIQGSVDDCTTPVPGYKHSGEVT